jgi:helix-turn-helix protein
VAHCRIHTDSLPPVLHAAILTPFSLPRVSELLNGKIANKSVDKLLRYAGRLGIEARANFTQTHKELVEKELALSD